MNPLIICTPHFLLCINYILTYYFDFVNKKWAENLPDHKELTKKTSNKPCKEESLHLYFNTKIYNCQQKNKDNKLPFFVHS